MQVHDARPRRLRAQSRRRRMLLNDIHPFYSIKNMKSS